MSGSPGWGLASLVGLFLSVVACAGSIANEPAVAPLRTEIATPAGPLAIEQVGNDLLGLEYNIVLAGKIVLHTKEADDHAAFPDNQVPSLVQYVAGPIGAFDGVAIFRQSNWGNACDGGPIWFLGIHRDGSFSASPPIDACGGAPPRVADDHGVIHLTLPRQGGPAEEWTYSGETLARIR
jgi:hypothetical protein